MDAQIISYNHDEWRVLGVGLRRNGTVFVHLASTTQFKQQRNGQRPVQICDWIPDSLIKSDGVGL